uniref:Uncharacterized protein n=1 Tax=Kalanchoe fedtschenkoi TaxID=63787 RepID=A0A7N0UNM8_KALFE
MMNFSGNGKLIGSAELTPSRNAKRENYSALAFTLTLPKASESTAAAAAAQTEPPLSHFYFLGTTPSFPPLSINHHISSKISSSPILKPLGYIGRLNWPCEYGFTLFPVFFQWKTPSQLLWLNLLIALFS